MQPFVFNGYVRIKNLSFFTKSESKHTPNVGVDHPHDILYYAQTEVWLYAQKHTLYDDILLMTYNVLNWCNGLQCMCSNVVLGDNGLQWVLQVCNGCSMCITCLHWQQRFAMGVLHVFTGSNDLQWVCCMFALGATICKWCVTCLHRDPSVNHYA